MLFFYIVLVWNKTEFQYSDLNLSFLLEIGKNDRKFKRELDGQILGEGGAYDARKDYLDAEYNPEKNDCLYMTVCDETDGSDCSFNSGKDIFF